MATINSTPVISKADEASATNDRFAQAKANRQAAIAKRDAEGRDPAEREREDDTGGHRLKLSVIGTIPGHHMYWENDEDGKIEQLLFEGFDFVEPGEVHRAADLVADMDLSNRVSRYVGRREDNSPLRAYLMKVPQEIWDKRKEREQRQANDWDKQIREGRMQPKGRDEYVPKGYESKLETNSKV